MQPRRGRNGQVHWRHVDVRHVDGPWKCRGCPQAAQRPWKFYCSSACRKAFLASVPLFWPELASKIRRRDGHRCVLCGGSGKDERTLRVRLEVDHIKPVALYPELEFDESNLRTLCHACHVKHGARPHSKRWARIHGPRIERRLDAPFAVVDGVCACGRDTWHCCAVFACGLSSCPSCGPAGGTGGPAGPTPPATSSLVPITNQGGRKAAEQP